MDYTVPQAQILRGVDGYVAPGMLLALMGASGKQVLKDKDCWLFSCVGAGKTTLLDVLAARKNIGKTEGTIQLNGKPIDKYFNRHVAYVEQVSLT